MDTSQLVQQLGAWRRFNSVHSRALASSLEALILAGDLVPGDVLPPERAFAAVLCVSRTMVVAAYDMLRESGWVQSRRGSGTLVAKGAPGYVTASRRRSAVGNPMATRPADADIAVIDLSVTVATPDAAWLSLSAAARARLLQELPYQPQGLLSLRERIAARFSQQGIATTASQVLITNGAQQAISLVAMRYANAGRRVIVEDPTYFGALDSFRAAGSTLVPVPFTQHTNAPEVFVKHVLEGRGDVAYVCPTVQNPTGITWTIAERKALAQAAASTGMLVMVDDTLSDLTFDGRHYSPSHYAPDAPIITVGSLSKTLWGGLRIGWLRASQPIIDALTGDRLVHDIGGSLLSAAIACDMIDSYDVLLAARKNALRIQRDACVNALRKHLPDWKFTIPAGGIFLWIQLPAMAKATSVTAFVLHAISFGVIVTPGTTLLISRQDACFIRLSYSAPDSVCVEGILRLKAAWLSFADSSVNAG